MTEAMVRTESAQPLTTGTQLHDGGFYRLDASGEFVALDGSEYRLFVNGVEIRLLVDRAGFWRVVVDGIESAWSSREPLLMLRAAWRLYHAA